MNIENEEYASAISELISLAISGKIEFLQVEESSSTDKACKAVDYVLGLAKKANLLKFPECLKDE